MSQYNLKEYRWYCRLVLLLYGLIASALVNAEQRSVSLDNLDTAGSIDLAPFLLYMPVTEEKTVMQVASMEQQAWTKAKPGKTNYGQSMADYWFKFKLDGALAHGEHAYLRLNYGNLDTVDVFYVIDGEIVAHYQAGDSLLFNVRPIPERIPLFPLNQLTQDSVDIYIKVFSLGPLEVPLDIVTRTEFDRQEKLTMVWVGIYFGILGIMFFYNLCVYLVVKDRAYLYYIAYVGFTACLQFSLRCFGFEYLWPNSASLNNLMIVMFSSLMPLAAVGFVKEFMQLKNSGDRIDYMIANTICGSFMLLFVASFFFSYMHVLKLIHAMAFVTIGFGFYIGLKYWSRGVRAARIFALAWFVYLVFGVLYLLEITGIAQTNPVTKYALELGSVLELTLLSLAFGDRINQEKEHIARLLNATKALSIAGNKEDAAQIALDHLQTLCPRLRVTDASLYLVQPEPSLPLAYILWADGKRLEQPLAEVLTSTTNEKLALSHHLSLQEHQLIAPIRLEKRVFGHLCINRYQGQANDLTTDSNLIESVLHSLAQTMESIDSEEKERLSMVGAMAAAIVHDLKNPIGAIQGCAVLASKPTQSEADRAKYLNSIITETHRMKEMAQEVLEISSGEIKLKRQHVLAQAFLSDMAEVIEPMLNLVDIKFTRECHVFKSIYIDSDRLHRVILNLVTNARDAMRHGKTESPHICLLLNEADGEVHIHVKDNGPGIPKAIRGNLFEPFVTSGKAEGTGLGMAIVRKIILAHEGDISFTTGDQGTEFIIRLPMDEASTKPNVVSFPETSSPGTNSPGISLDLEESDALSNQHILVVEDNMVNQMVLRKYLQSWGAVVDVCENGLDALNWLANHQTSVILMDIEMPEMDGIEATQQIRHTQAYASIPIIGLTGHSAEAEIIRCMGAGMNDVVTKPVEPKILFNKLLAILK